MLRESFFFVGGCYFVHCGPFLIIMKRDKRPSPSPQMIFLFVTNGGNIHHFCLSFFFSDGASNSSTPIPSPGIRKGKETS